MLSINCFVAYSFNHMLSHIFYDILSHYLFISHASYHISSLTHIHIPGWEIQLVAYEKYNREKQGNAGNFYMFTRCRSLDKYIEMCWDKCKRCETPPLQKHFIPGMALVSALVITLQRKMKCSFSFSWLHRYHHKNKDNYLISIFLKCFQHQEKY